MGTNFYYRKSGILGIGTVEEKHIGKRSANGLRAPKRWSFLFRAHLPDIRSWKEWKEILTRKKAGKIFDEYDKEWTPAEFIAMVEENKPDDPLGFSSIYGDTFTDPEGFTFCLTDFC